MSQSNYTTNKIEPTTFQERVTPHHNFNAYRDDIEVAQGESIAMMSLDVRADPHRTIFVKTTTNFTIYVQLTDDDSDDPEWYDLMTLVSGVPTMLTIIVNNASVAIPIFAKAMQMRILALNNGAASTPVIGVI